MKNSLFYNHVEENEYNKSLMIKIQDYINLNTNEQLYLINAPLGENKYSYEYEDKAIVILSPKHKIIFLDLNNNEEDFNEYCDDFIEDLGFISDKFNYKKYIGRAKKWENELTIRENLLDELNFNDLLDNNKLEKGLQRKNELLISLLVGSINNIDKIGLNEPKTILEKIKNKIILFDGEQTRFIYKQIEKKSIYIQGLSGTGKTELLLHKLKEMYSSSDESKIFFTCHNIALANTLKKRIPEFFNFMKVEKQIEWNKRLWLDRAWGSQRDKNSGLYSYICNFYNIQFFRYSFTTNYEKIFTKALEEIEKIDKDDFEYAFDYILIDESQDFPDIFFKLCEKITKYKVYIAGDIFQDIFESNIEQKVINVDFILNRCYRTDPRTLMFSHAIGMGLFEDKKFNWLTDKEWEASGYKIERNNRDICLYREPIRRFEDLDIDQNNSMEIQKLNSISQVITIIQNIKNENETLMPDDIGIIVLDDNKTIYDFIDKLEFEIMSKMQWQINRSYESKEKIDNTLFVSNKNNAKGLEFPFVICITAKIKDDYKYRNTLYTMITRSFIKSYLLVKNDTGLDVQQNGLKIINNRKCIKTVEPTDDEKSEIERTIIQLKEEQNISYKDFLTKIFNDLKIDTRCRKKLEKMISEMLNNSFDKEKIINFIEDNKKYC